MSSTKVGKSLNTFFIKYWKGGLRVGLSKICIRFFVGSSLPFGKNSFSRSIINCRGGRPTLTSPTSQLRARDWIIRSGHPPLPGQSLQIKRFNRQNGVQTEIYVKNGTIFSIDLIKGSRKQLFFFVARPLRGGRAWPLDPTQHQKK